MNEIRCPKCNRLMTLKGAVHTRLDRIERTKSRYLCGECAYQNGIETDTTGAMRLLWEFRPVTWQSVGARA